MALWKRLNDLSLSDRHARISFELIGIWTYLMGQTDSKGRFHADPRIIRAKAMTMRENIRLDQIEKGITALAAVGLLHRYSVDGRPFFVLHRCGKYNPPGALSKIPPVYPAPPEDLCPCLKMSALQASEEDFDEDDVDGVPAPPVPSSSVSSSDPKTTDAKAETVRSISERIIRERKTPSKEQTVYKYVLALVERGFARQLDAWAFDAKNTGKDVLAMQDEIAPRLPHKPAAPPAVRVNAPTSRPFCVPCNSTGMLMVKQKHPRTGQELEAATPCPHCSVKK